MSVTGKCINTCTVPVRGFIEEDQVIDFPETDSWDVKAFPYLKHFEEIVGIFEEPVEEEIVDEEEDIDDEEGDVFDEDEDSEPSDS